LYANGNPVSLYDADGQCPCVVPIIEGVLEKGGEVLLAQAIRWAVKKAARNVAATIVKEGTGDNDNKNRGRIQIQSTNGIEMSVPWSTKVPLSKKDGRRALAQLENELIVVNYKMYKRLTQCGAFDDAVRFINQAPVVGYDATGKSKSFDCKPNQVNGERIDFKIITGRAFVGY